MDPSKFTTGTVVARQDLSEDLWTVRIRPAVPIDFRAGQYVTVGIQADGRLLERPYSIVSSPDEAELELFVELVPPGVLTPHLHRLPDGAEVSLRPRCKGIFLKECPVAGEDHLFVSTVTGIAPFVSFLRRLAARHRAGEWAPAGERFLLLQGASRAHEFGYLEEMRALAVELPWFDYVATVSRPWLDPEWAGEVGRVEEVMRKHADGFGVTPGRAGVFLCGHPGMIAGARGIMRRRGIEDSAIREEQYWPEGQTPGTR